MPSWEEIRNKAQDCSTKLKDKGAVLGGQLKDKTQKGAGLLKEKSKVYATELKERSVSCANYVKENPPFKEEVQAVKLDLDFKKRLSALEAIPDAGEKQRQATELLVEYASLPAKFRPALGYRLSKMGASFGHAGDGKELWPDLPFSFCGFADYPDFEFGGMSEGFAYRIKKAAFGSRSDYLYYRDQDGWPARVKDPGRILRLIQSLSSGISQVELLPEVYGGGFRFKLDRRALRPQVILNRLPVDTQSLGGYVLVIPRAGEFDCELGEILAGRNVCLHRDSFCMK